MAECPVCGKHVGFFAGDELRRCESCMARGLFPDGHAMSDAAVQEQKEDHAKRKEDYEIERQVLLTTESNPDLNITKRIEIVTAECAYGMNIFKDLFAGVRNIVGGRSEAVQSTMRDARKTVLSELKREAHAVGANAVVGVDLDYVELAGSGSSMLMLVASGTAVVIEDAQN
jgi:uncharacterized protein YbjQ (UPF0145 family)